MYKNLQIGSTGNEVKILQEKLKILGYYNATITGSFGLGTKEGVIAFQEYENLPSTGVVDEETWNAIIEKTESPVSPISTYPTLSFGSTGSYVTDLQTKLKSLLYYPQSINGNYDLETETAVKRFQLNNELTADGIVGNETWNRINSLYGNLNSCVLNNDNNSENNSTSYLTYTVKSGDTLYSIANRYNTTVEALKLLNNLTSNTLQIGQILKIPTREQDDYIKYTVKSGDTLYSIARRYNTTVAEIKSLNNLNSDLLKVGQVLNIPTTGNESYITYIVQRGDSLYSIAKRYNTSVDTLKSLNNLTSDLLIIGQVLKVPTTAGVNYITYTVQSGDTLYSIANRYNTSVNNIKQFNNLTSNNLQIGQILKIPL